MEGLLTHVATADCFITPPHPALDCGIVTAWWQYQVKGTRAPWQHKDEQRQRQPGTTTAFRSDPPGART
jgi:hypothetical protein